MSVKYIIWKTMVKKMIMARIKPFKEFFTFKKKKEKNYINWMGKWNTICTIFFFHAKCTILNFLQVNFHMLEFDVIFCNLKIIPQSMRNTWLCFIYVMFWIALKCWNCVCYYLLLLKLRLLNLNLINVLILLSA